MKACEMLIQIQVRQIWHLRLLFCIAKRKTPILRTTLRIAGCRLRIHSGLYTNAMHIVTLSDVFCELVVKGVERRTIRDLDLNDIE